MAAPNFTMLLQAHRAMTHLCSAILIKANFHSMAFREMTRFGLQTAGYTKAFWMSVLAVIDSTNPQHWVDNHYEYINYYHTDYVLNNHANSAGTVKIVSHAWNPSEDIQLGSGSTVNLHIIGNDEHNIISGKTGNDLLTGNGGSDIFVFGAGFGHDRMIAKPRSGWIKFGWMNYRYR